MDIISLLDLKYNTTTQLYNLFYPRFIYGNITLYTYTVQNGEEMRMDLVMMSIYDDATILGEMDVLLFINGIDNPLNISEGDIIYYPAVEVLPSFRFLFDEMAKVGESVTKTLATPNKTTKKDSNRKTFVESGYSLPPVVLEESKPPVRLEGDKIVIGGLN